jgi:uncharacterized protein
MEIASNFHIDPKPRKRKDSMPNALVLYGGWPGHQPERFAALAKERLFEGFDIEVTTDLKSLESSDLGQRDLILPVWTHGELSTAQERGLLRAIEGGTGLVGFHGTADAFRSNPAFHFLLGGSFTAHPGDVVEYTVHILAEPDPITSGLTDFQICSEQYYMLIAPDNEVLATTTFSAQPCPWIAGTVMPVVWKRLWGGGRVFYSAIGHDPQEWEIAQVLTLMQRGTAWAGKAV